MLTILRSPHFYTGCCAAAIAVLMMVPGDALPDLRSWLPLTLEQWIDKIQHIVAFGVLMILATRSLSEVESIRRPVITSALATLGYSFLLEIMQALVPWRNFDPADMVADTVGVALVAPLAVLVVRWVGSRGASRDLP